MSCVEHLDELKKLDQWICWKHEVVKDRETKVPKNPKAGYDASSTNPETWTSYTEACSQAPSYDGLGFVFTENDGIVGIDLDDCVEDGEIKPWAITILHDLDSYAEYSPSGEGIHIFTKGEIERGFNNQKKDVEMYFTKRYFTVTGHHIGFTPTYLNDNQAALTEVWKKYKTNNNGATGEKIAEVAEKIRNTPVSPDGARLKLIRSRDEKLDALLGGPHSEGYPSASEADGATAMKLILHGFNDGETYSIMYNHRYREKFDRHDYLPRTIASARAELGIGVKKLKTTLSTSIKHDNTTKAVLFLDTLLNYTKEDQQNVGLNSVSSSGKTHVALECVEYFPTEDVVPQGYTSPRAFYHEHGQLTRENGEPLETRYEYTETRMEEWYKENPEPEEGKTKWAKREKGMRSKLKNEWNGIPKVIRVDLERKIFVFLDQPDDKLLTNLRSVMSHDRKVIRTKITDSGFSGGHRTKAVDLVGYPTMIFLSTSFTKDQQDRTRLWLLSAEITQEKLKTVIKLQGEELRDRQAYREKLDLNKERENLKMRVLSVKHSGITDVLIDKTDMDGIVNRFIETHPKLIPRLTRDFPRLIALVKAHALLNHVNRVREGDRIHAEQEDITAAEEIYKEVAAPNELGIPPEVYKFYKDKIEPALRTTPHYMTLTEIRKAYYDLYMTRLGEKQLKQIREILAEAGLAAEDQHPEDRRKIIITHPTVYEPPPKTPAEPPKQTNL